MSSREGAERTVRDIRRKTRKQYSAEEKIRIVVSGLRGEDSIAELCRREGIAESLYYSWSKEFLEAGKKRLSGDTARQASSGEVKELIESLTEAKAAGNLSRRLRVLTHPALLLVDEIGHLPVNQDGAVLFFQLINARHEKASTVLTSNKGFEDWGGVLGDEVMAAALIDRLVHHCHIVNIRGNSYRMRDHQNLLQANSDRRRKRAHVVIPGETAKSIGAGRPLWITGLSPPDSWRSLRQPGYPQLHRARHPQTPYLGARPHARSVRFSIGKSVQFSVGIDTDHAGCRIRPDKGGYAYCRATDARRRSELGTTNHRAGNPGRPTHADAIVQGRVPGRGVGVVGASVSCG